MGYGHTIPRETLDARYDWLMIGSVTDNQDPLPYLGRVRVLVPGLLEPESRWAFPIGMMFGPQRGLWAVPEVGSNVAVFLREGDVDHPFYMAGPWGAPEDAEPHAPEQGRDPNKLSWVWDGFHITFDGTPGQEKLTIEDVEKQTKIEFNRVTGNLEVLVGGDMEQTIQGSRQVTIQQGSDTLNVIAGSREENIGQGRTVNVLAGDDVKTVAAGNSSETVVGQKSVLATTVQVTALTLLNLLGPAVSIQSTGAGTESFAGLLTRQLLGGLSETVVGAIVRNVTGTITWTVSGVITLASNTVLLGNGVQKALMNEDFGKTTFPSHVHIDSNGVNTSVPVDPVPGTDFTENVKAS